MCIVVFGNLFVVFKIESVFLNKKKVSMSLNKTNSHFLTAALNQLVDIHIVLARIFLTIAT